MMQVIQVSTLIMFKYNDNLFKNNLVLWKSIVFKKFDVKIKRATIGVNLMHKLNLLLPRSSLLTVYKCFIRPHLNYGDVVYDQPNLSYLTNKIKSVQCNAALAIVDSIRWKSKEKLYQDLGFESLKDKSWLRL